MTNEKCVLLFWMRTCAYSARKLVIFVLLALVGCLSCFGLFGCRFPRFMAAIRAPLPSRLSLLYFYLLNAPYSTLLALVQRRTRHAPKKRFSFFSSLPRYSSLGGHAFAKSQNAVPPACVLTHSRVPPTLPWTDFFKILESGTNLTYF